MIDWHVHSLSEVYDFSSGLSKPRSEFGSGYPFLSFKDVFYNRFVPLSLTNLVQSNPSERTKCSIKRGDVFLTRTSETMDELGMSCVSLSDVPNATFNGFTKRLRPKDDGYILPEYAGYFFGSSRFRASVNAMSTMSTRASLNNDMLARLEIVVPTFDEQKQIAGCLKPLDDKIEMNRRMNETLEEMALALFRDWFVDFGPTRRQMQGATDPAAIMGNTFPTEKAATLAPLFPATLEDNGLPEGWNKRPVGELSDIVGGGTPNTKTIEFWEGGTHLWATPRDLSKLSGVFISKTERRLTKSGLAKVSSGLSPKGSVLMSSRAPIGYLAIASEPTSVNQGFIVLRPTATFPPHFAKLWCEANMETIEANANGSTFQEISKKNFKPILATVPDEEVMAAFTATVGLLFDKIEANEKENQTLTALRDLLLPKLMSGEIRLKDVEAVVE